jgi:hypothetical protein
MALGAGGTHDPNFCDARAVCARGDSGTKVLEFEERLTQALLCPSMTTSLICGNATGNGARRDQELLMLSATAIRYEKHMKETDITWQKRSSKKKAREAKKEMSSPLAGWDRESHNRYVHSFTLILFSMRSYAIRTCLLMEPNRLPS